MFTTIPIAKECIKVLMEATPTNLKLTEFTNKLESIKNVITVHDLHVWSLSAGKPSMSAHIVA